MAKEEIFDKLKELVVDQLGVEEDEVTMEATMQDDLEIGRASCRERV